MDIASGEASQAAGSRHLWHRSVYGLWSPLHVPWLLFITQNPVFSAQHLTNVALCELFLPPPPIPKSLRSQVELSATELLLVLPNHSRSSPPSKHLPFLSFLCQLQGDPALITAGQAELSLQLPPNSSSLLAQRCWRINPKGRGSSALRTYLDTECVPPKQIYSHCPVSAF